MVKRLEELFVVLFLVFICCACKGEYIPEERTRQIIETDYMDNAAENNMESGESNNQYTNQKETAVVCEVFGKNGYYIESEVYPDWYRRTYFLKDNCDIPVAVCEGFVLDDYHIDIDNDGIKEILCNRVAGGDGHRELYIYRYENEKVYIGFVNWLEKDLPGLFYWGCNAVQTKYDNDRASIVIMYGTKLSDGSISTISTEVPFDWVEYVECDGKTRPFIDIEKAYELYGDR